MVESHRNPLNTDLDGESYDGFKNRVVDSLKEIMERKNNIVTIVSHGGPIKQILAYLNKPIPEKISDGKIIEIET